MSAPPTIESRPRRRGRTILFYGLSIVLALVIGAVIWHVAWRFSNVSAIRRLEQKIRERGEPLTLAELAGRYPAIPDDQNAAVPLLQLWEKEDPLFWEAFLAGKSDLPERVQWTIEPAVPFRGSDWKKLPRSSRLAEPNLAAAKTFLDTHADHYASVRAALSRPSARFPVTITNGYAALLPHLALLKAEAQNFRVAEIVALENGDTDAALSSIRDILGVARLLKDSPALIDQLIRIAASAMALDDAERLLNRAPLLEPQLERLAVLIEQTSMADSWHSALISERAFALSAFEWTGDAFAQIASSGGADADHAPEDPQALRAGLRVMKVLGYTSADHRFMLETLEEATAVSQLDWPEQVVRNEQLFQRFEQEARRFPPKIFSRMLLPALGKAESKFASFEARRRPALAAIAVERYRQSEGRLPEGIENLVPRFLPDVPIDPMDRQPLRFRTRPAGYVVYSVGVDRTDDAGSERPPTGTVAPFDETFVVER